MDFEAFFNHAPYWKCGQTVLASNMSYFPANDLFLSCSTGWRNYLKIHEDLRCTNSIYFARAM
jgi:hypothetical protein